MSGARDMHDEALAEKLALYSLGALPGVEAAALEHHLAVCDQCRQELSELRPVLEAMVSWPTDVVRPAAPLWERVAQRIDARPGIDAPAASAEKTSQRRWIEPAWLRVAPGISCKLLSTDDERHRISMLVRLDPGAEYPPHQHAGLEELHLLDGELWINERKLHPGDYSRAEAGTADKRVWSETGCTCVLVTSTRDVLF